MAIPDLIYFPINGEYLGAGLVLKLHLIRVFLKFWRWAQKRVERSDVFDCFWLTSADLRVDVEYIFIDLAPFLVVAAPPAQKK